MTDIQKNYNNPYRAQQQFGAYSVPLKGSEDDGYLNKRIANKNEDDSSWAKDTLIEGTRYGIPMSVAFVHGTNWLMKPKKITDTMSQISAYENSRLYKLGNLIDNSAPVKFLSNQTQKAGNLLSRIPVPQAFKDLWGKIKIGTVSTWDGSGMYTLGKKSEAMQETMRFFSEVGDDNLKKLTLSKYKQNALLKLMEKFRAGKINNIKGFKILDWLMRDVSAKELQEISKKSGIAGKILGTSEDLSLSLSKARFFAGMDAKRALDKAAKEALKQKGPIGKLFNKVASLIGEASGGGVLGGPGALLMNAFALSSGFAAAKKADKGEKVSAFMEDYMGLTLGSYLGMMFEGWLMHKALGAAEHGMQLNNSVAKEVAKELGLKKPERVQDLIIAYNREFKQTKALNKIVKQIEKGKVTDGGRIPILSWIWNKITGKTTVDDINKMLQKAGISNTSNDLNVIKSTIQNSITKKDKTWFNTIRGKIMPLTKSDTSFMSIFKGKQGTFFNRFCEWFTKGPIAKTAKLFATGKYTMLKDGNFIGNGFRRFKRVGGGLGRMFLIAAILIKPISNSCMKLSHKIFGKPKKSILDEDKEKEQPNGQDISQTQGGMNVPQGMPGQNQPGQYPPSQNLVDMYTKGLGLQPKQQGLQQGTQQGAGQPPQPGVQPNNGTSFDKATYIPNQILTQESYIDPGVTQDLLTRRDLALKRADAAERNAQELLSRL